MEANVVSSYGRLIGFEKHERKGNCGSWTRDVHIHTSVLEEEFKKMENIETSSLCLSLLFLSSSSFPFPLPLALAPFPFFSLFSSLLLFLLCLFLPPRQDSIDWYSNSFHPPIEE